MPDDPTRAAPQIATVRLDWKEGLRARAHLVVTPLGLLATGGLVAAILLSVPPIVRAAAEARRASGRRRDGAG